MKNDMKHTPGPWRVEDGRVFGNEPSVDDEVLICDVAPSNEALTEFDITNARLIASAPEMFEALELAEKLVRKARQYFPKSIRNSDRFDLENTCATIGKALYKATGGK